MDCTMLRIGAMNRLPRGVNSSVMNGRMKALFCAFYRQRRFYPAYDPKRTYSSSRSPHFCGGSRATDSKCHAWSIISISRIKLSGILRGPRTA